MFFIYENIYIYFLKTLSIILFSIKYFSAKKLFYLKAALS